METNNLPQIAKKVRREIIKMVYEAGSGHLAGPLSATDLLVALYFGGIMNNNDKFILSCGHYAPALYAVFAEGGMITEKELGTFGSLGTRLQGHPHNLSLPGIETSSGPLGLGLAQAAGMAFGAKFDEKTETCLPAGRKQKNSKIYCLMSDGEQSEGGVWETAMFCAKYKLDNLCAIIDKNGIQIDGKTLDIMPTEDLAAKYLAFGWEVFEIEGHIFGQILDTLESAKGIKNKPTVIIARTIAGKGIFFMEGKWEWHHGKLTEEQYQKAIEELG